MAGQTNVTIRIVSNRLPTISAAIKSQIVAAVARRAHAIQAAAQGFAPVKTGTLRRSILVVFANGGLSAMVGPSVDYGIYQEFGSRGRAPHPFMRPAAEQEFPAFRSDLQTILARAA